jgi:hypothetical protein
LKTTSSSASMQPAATITAQAGSKNAPITSRERTGTGASQRRARRLAEMTAEHTSKTTLTTPNKAIATMAVSAVLPNGIISRIGTVARATILGCAQAKAWRIGQAPSALKEGRIFAARRNLGGGT